MKGNEIKITANINETGNITYTWWCPKCQVDHYTPYCPLEEHERLASSWKDFGYEVCPYCSQLVNQGGWR